MRPELQESSETERGSGRTEAVSTKVSPREKQALQLLATVKKTTTYALIYDAIAPLLEEGEGMVERLSALAEV
jgi:hypothetical protein